MSKTLKIKMYLLTLVIIFMTSIISTLLLLFYMNVETNLRVWFVIMWTAIFLSLSSFLTLLIFFFKKIYYRWDIYVRNLNSSLRQWVLLTSFLIWNVIFKSTWVFTYKTSLLLFFVIFFIELIFQSMWD